MVSTMYYEIWEASLMRFDEDKSVDYNYEVGFLEGMRMALSLMMTDVRGVPSLEASVAVLTQEIREQVETVKEMDE